MWSYNKEIGKNMVVHIVWVPNWIVENVLAICWASIHSILHNEIYWEEIWWITQEAIDWNFHANYENIPRHYVSLSANIPDKLFPSLFLLLVEIGHTIMDFPLARPIQESMYYSVDFSCHQVGTEEKNLNFALKSVPCKQVSAPDLLLRTRYAISARVSIQLLMEEKCLSQTYDTTKWEHTALEM